MENCDAPNCPVGANHMIEVVLLILDRVEVKRKYCAFHRDITFEAARQFSDPELFEFKITELT